MEYDLAANGEPENGHVSFVCYNFLKAIGILLPDGFEPEFWQYYSGELKGRTSKSAKVDASILAILRHTMRVAGTGLPGTLLIQCVAFMQRVAIQALTSNTERRNGKVT